MNNFGRTLAETRRRVNAKNKAKGVGRGTGERGKYKWIKRCRKKLPHAWRPRGQEERELREESRQVDLLPIPSSYPRYFNIGYGNKLRIDVKAASPAPSAGKHGTGTSSSSALRCASRSSYVLLFPLYFILSLFLLPFVPRPYFYFVPRCTRERAG